MSRSAPDLVWFSRGLSNVYDAVRLLRAADPAGRLRVLASDTRAHAPALSIADDALLEPRGVSETAFVDWCLGVCVERGVRAFLPGGRVLALARRRAEFAAVGTRLMVAGDADTLALVDDKAALYEHLGSRVPQPAWRVVRTAEDMDAAMDALRPGHPRLCVKPVVSMFGLGFHTLVERDDPYSQFLGADPVPRSVASTRRLLVGQERPRALLLMEYLPGPERSVDCLAMNGELVVAVARQKRGDHQVIETEGPAVDIAREVVRALRLDGLVNVQTRDGRGEPRLLEVNARMSGGLLYACLAGTALPYWAVQLALGNAAPADVPRPRAGVIVAPVQGAIVVGQVGGALPAEGEADPGSRMGWPAAPK
ncbi:MAG: ATP-grasp domain-containing protein [Pseudomonadota bacterium]|nr:ATP-grasp domain-containing protein [Pseudomonadota bacterium]